MQTVSSAQHLEDPIYLTKNESMRLEGACVLHPAYNLCREDWSGR